jgi:hypothetical protein
MELKCLKSLRDWRNWLEERGVMGPTAPKEYPCLVLWYYAYDECSYGEMNHEFIYKSDVECLFE